MISFKRIDINDMPWDELPAFTNASVFQTRPWIDFLADFFRAEPVVAAVLSGDQIVGYFTGLIIKKFGLKILGSPLRGWNTYFMGFSMMSGVLYHDVLQAFPKFVFDELKCHFLMLVDINIKADDCKGLSYHVREFTNFKLDLRKSEDDIFAAMKGRSCRTSIRRTIKRGVVIEEANDPDFVKEYFTQYQEVNARKSLPPYYGLDFLQNMIACLQPTGNLLLLRARNAEGVCIATQIDLVFKKEAVVWGTASATQYLSLRPNELIYWSAMRKVKAMGAEELHLADGVRQFKEKFGSRGIQAYRLMKAKHSLLYNPIFVGISIDARLRGFIRKIFGWQV